MICIIIYLLFVYMTNVISIFYCNLFLSEVLNTNQSSLLTHVLDYCNLTYPRV